MSKIDERISRMVFDNKQFEEGVRQSSKSLTDFDNLLGKAGDNTGMSGLSGVVGGVADKFSTLGTIATGALLEIGRQAVQIGQQMVQAFAIEPLAQGFEEYEIKIGAIRTILASGKTSEGLPVTLDMVNEQLQELNDYADQTIYSFSDMTQNIGKFTNAGVDLESSVAAIKGISNAAALAGSNSNEASRAMYNFAQALSAGYVKLIDWKSIENANMATVDFKDSLLEAAVAVGTVEKSADGMYKVLTENGQGKLMKGTIDATHNFNDSLQYQWMTTEVLVDVLGDYASTQTEVGKKANEAATKVRTFTQLIDTTKEAIGSGWAQSFEIMFGDFEEATKLWTGLSDAIGDMVNSSSDARNKILKDWDILGGRKALIDGLGEAWKRLTEIAKPLKEAFTNVFPPVTAKMLADLSKRFKEFFQSIKMGPETTEKLKTAFQGFFSAISLGWDAIKFVFGLLKDALDALLPSGDGLLDLAEKVGQFFIDLKKAADDGNVFVVAAQNIKDSVKWIKDAFIEFGKSIVGVVNALIHADDIPGALKAIAGSFSNFPVRFPALDGFLDKVKEFTAPIRAFAGVVGELLVQAFNRLKETLGSAWRTEGFNGVLEVINTLLTGGIFIGIQQFIKSLTDIGKKAGGFLDSIIGVFDGLKGVLKAYQEQIKAKILKDIAVAIAILAGSVLVLAMIDAEKLRNASIAIGALFAELAGTFVALDKLVSGVKIASIGNQLLKFAASILTLSLALKNIADIDSDKLVGAMTALSLMIGEMAGFSAVISKLGNGGSLLAAGVAMNLFASSFAVMSGVVTTLGNLNYDKLVQGLFAISVLMAEIAGVSVILSKAVNPVALAATGSAMIAIGTALLAVSGAVAILGNLDQETVVQGILAMTAALIPMVAAMLLTSDPKVLAGAAAMLIMAAAVLVLTPAIAALGVIPLENIGVALLALIGVFAVLGGAAVLLGPLTPVIIALAAGITLLGVAVLAVGTGMALFAVGLATLAAGGTAGILLLKTAITELASLIPEVMAKIGEGIVKLAGVIAEGAPKIAEAIVAVITEIIGLLTNEIPLLIDTVLTFLEELLLKLVEKVPIFVDAGMKIMIGFLEGVANNLQPIVEAVLQMLIELLDGISAKLPDLIRAGADLIIAFLEGMGKEIPRVIDAGFKMIIDFINGMADSIRENTPLLLLAVANLCTAFIDGILNFFGIGNGTSKEGKSMAMSILQGIIDGIGDMIDKVVTAVKDVAQKMIDGFKKLFGIHSPSKVMDGFGIDILQGLINGIKSMVNKLIDSVKEFVNKMIDTIKNKFEDFKTSGKTLIDNFVTGIVNTAENIYNAVRTFLSEMVTTIKNKVSDFIQAGKDLIGGIVKGIGEKVGEAVDSVKNLGSKVIEGAQNIFKTNSPSKVFTDIGQYCVDGLALGIEENSSEAVGATKKMGKETISAMKKTMEDISDILSSEMETSPVITPVLDLSNIETGANRLSSILASDSHATIGTISRANRSLLSNQKGSSLSDSSSQIINNFNIPSVVVRKESDIEDIAKKLYQRQQNAMRGRGVRTAFSTP